MTIKGALVIEYGTTMLCDGVVADVDQRKRRFGSVSFA